MVEFWIYFENKIQQVLLIFGGQKGKELGTWGGKERSQVWLQGFWPEKTRIIKLSSAKHSFEHETVTVF